MTDPKNKIMSLFRRPAGRSPSDGANLSETVDLVKRYVLQETLGPLKHLGKVFGLGLAGSLVYGVGLVFGLIGLLRVLQGETGSVFTGNFSFAPYLITAAVGALAIAATVALEWRSGRSVGQGALRNSSKEH